MKEARFPKSKIIFLKTIFGFLYTDFQFLKLMYIVIDIAVLINITLNSYLPLIAVVSLRELHCIC